MQNTNSSDNTCLEQAIEERLAARVENEKLSEENQYLKEEVQALKHRIAWFEKQIFGQKSEKRIIENPHQASLLTESTQTEAEEETSKETVNAYQRGKAKKERSDDCVTDSGLRFGPDVPVEIVEVMPPELTGPDADQYDVIDTKVTYKLAELSAAFVVLAYHLPILKKQAEVNNILLRQCRRRTAARSCLTVMRPIRVTPSNPMA